MSQTNFQEVCYRTVETNDLLFTTHVYINKLHLLAKIQFSNSKHSLTKNCQVSKICGKHTESWENVPIFPPIYYGKL